MITGNAGTAYEQHTSLFGKTNLTITLARDILEYMCIIQMNSIIKNIINKEYENNSILHE